MTVRTADEPVVIDAIELTEWPRPSLTIGGVGSPPEGITLEGARWRIEARLIEHGAVEGGRWSAAFPLTASRWGGPEQAGPSGRYRLRSTSAAEVRVFATLPGARLVADWFRIDFAATDTLEVHLSAPLADDEVGPEAQRRLEREYRAADPAPLNAVFFESFYGANASCNPLAIDRVLARTAPEVARYWSVADASVPVPDGAIPIIDGSREWWRVRGAARLLVVNDWLRNRHRRRRFQTVLQTWHGTPLKRIALGRPGVRPRAALATLRERSHWDVMLSQNAHSTSVFRRSYAFLGPVWQVGYPRDDVLVSGSAAADDVRARLGIPTGSTVLLYAPTWRDDRPDAVDHLDVARFAAELGHEYTVLVRGHARTMHPGADIHASGVIDVTTYPDASELFLVADALITDYSSVMFDFTVTGKPVFFFTPDLADYRDRLRGFSFDLLSVAPGPVVETVEALITKVRDITEVNTEYAEAYRAWRERFNPDDDGHAAERVVHRLLERRLIG